MRIKKQWSWDKATEGMHVSLKDLGKAKVVNGVVKEIGKIAKRRMMDGRPIQSMQVARVTILCDDGAEIVAERDSQQYQITLK